MSVDLKQYRINTICEYMEVVNRFNVSQREYYDALKKYLDELPSGVNFDIVANIPENLYKLFVKCVCIYILRDLSGSVEFSDDYLIVRKRKPT